MKINLNASPPSSTNIKEKQLMENNFIIETQRKIKHLALLIIGICIFVASISAVLWIRDTLLNTVLHVAVYNKLIFYFIATFLSIAVITLLSALDALGKIDLKNDKLLVFTFAAISLVISAIVFIVFASIAFGDAVAIATSLIIGITIFSITDATSSFFNHYKTQRIKHIAQLLNLRPLSSYNRQFINDHCQQNPMFSRYRNKVYAQKRPFIEAEYTAFVEYNKNPRSKLTGY